MFPFFDVKIDDIKTTIPREYAWDFELNDFVLKNGAPYIVEGIDALKIWIYKTLKTERYEHLAYSWDYGTELKSLLGTKMQKSAGEAAFKSALVDALMINPNITGVNNVRADISKGAWQVEAVVMTAYGEVTINV